MNSERLRQAGGSRPLSIRSLSAVKDVEIKDRGYSALSEAPWLRVEFDGPPPAGRWIRLSYAASLFDPLVRPLIRCVIGGRYHDEILPGPLFGRAEWLGYVPKGTQEIWISPTNRPGPFRFVIERMTTLSAAKIIWRCLRENPRHCAVGLGAHLVGLRSAATREFRRALSPTQLKNYGDWRKCRLRDLDLANLDLPLVNWRRGAHIRFLTILEADRLDDLRVLLSQLNTQAYPQWSLAVISSFEIEKLLGPATAASRAQVTIVPPAAMICDALEGLSDDDFVAPIALGDQIPAYAVAALAEAANRDPGATIFFGDQDFINSEGWLEAPKLRTDWNPTLFAVSPDSDGTEFFQVKTLRPFASDTPAAELLRTRAIMTKIGAHQRLSVGHIRRVMRSRRQTPTVRSVVQELPNPGRARSQARGVSGISATIIIPTKDRIDLLRICVESLKEKTSMHEFEVIVVDNGSERTESQRFFTELARDARFRIISRPGPFNFSRLCNDAAVDAKAPTLVFLNNDTEVRDRNWLEPLLYWTQQSDVGAVGAKLLYPDGRLQHAGVVLGLDGLAGHFERLLKSDDPGYFERLCLPHEVSAVTAACLAVDKRKFEAIGGFDAVNLPVDLNDIDLCLRLAERGWKSIFTPESVLIHHESASRGKKLRAEEIYRKERQYFRGRWMHRLRDDPYFHPALSLDSHDVALG